MALKLEERILQIINQETERYNKMKALPKSVDYKKSKKIMIGIIPGDGIGPIIMNEAVKTITNTTKQRRKS
ncbi:hypothetical protein [Enterococcus casseliflavus]|uniref:hypothetical protein n=1 Tax=Enterococcus casseliflavus TaxID=37734 RepID=UPI001884033C|nr:hypothetical protein [Enterococcus casseliflavus]MBE9909409.1 hypothetical protein [Enterococcus casseliflavus]